MQRDVNEVGIKEGENPGWATEAIGKARPAASCTNPGQLESKIRTFRSANSIGGFGLLVVLLTAPGSPSSPVSILDMQHTPYAPYACGLEFVHWSLFEHKPRVILYSEIGNDELH